MRRIRLALAAIPAALVLNIAQGGVLPAGAGAPTVGDGAGASATTLNGFTKQVVATGLDDLYKII
ncbi:hypothetical protein ACFUIT_08700 [Streptomyces sp. NPDC057239]|uniref:hypothetical protein n=1 Tax=Streptomyces sp. NPDC057239 TaxID=3346061 RepID=UPI003643F6CF